VTIPRTQSCQRQMCLWVDSSCSCSCRLPLSRHEPCLSRFLLLKPWPDREADKPTPASGPWQTDALLGLASAAQPSIGRMSLIVADSSGGTLAPARCRDYSRRYAC